MLHSLFELESEVRHRQADILSRARHNALVRSARQRPQRTQHAPGPLQLPLTSLLSQRADRLRRIALSSLGTTLEHWGRSLRLAAG